MSFYFHREIIIGQKYKKRSPEEDVFKRKLMRKMIVISNLGNIFSTNSRRYQTVNIKIDFVFYFQLCNIIHNVVKLSAKQNTDVYRSWYTTTQRTYISYILSHIPQNFFSQCDCLNPDQKKCYLKVSLKDSKTKKNSIKKKNTKLTSFLALNLSLRES